MNRREERGGTPRPPEGEGAALPEAGAPHPEGARVVKRKRKVSLVGALVVNVVTVIAVAIIIVAILLPGYRRSFTAAKAMKGADKVWVVVLTSESNIRANNTDFTRAQDGLKNSFQELVGTGGDNVFAYVRDNYPARSWIESNLPEEMRKWLEELYPKETPADQNLPEGTTSGQEQDAAQEVRP